MNAYIALLRAVNVGGTGKLPMTELKSMCEAAGFKQVRTYMASGNVVFKSSKSEAQVKALLEAALAAYAGKAGCRDGANCCGDGRGCCRQSVFTNAWQSHDGFFLDNAPAADAMKTVTNQTNEQIKLGVREIYGYYPDGMGVSKLKIPAAKNGTARNMNTIAKLAEMAAGLE